MKRPVDAASRWSHFPHGADVGVCGTGATKATAFEQAALALTAAVTDPAGVDPRAPVDVSCEAPDDGLLLADWLNALVYEMATRRMLFGQFQVVISGTRREERLLDDALLEALRAAGAPGRITFEDPDAVVVVETVGDRAGLSVWGSEDLNRHPFLRPD